MKNKICPKCLGNKWVWSPNRAVETCKFCMGQGEILDINLDNVNRFLFSLENKEFELHPANCNKYYKMTCKEKTLFKEFIKLKAKYKLED